MPGRRYTREELDAISEMYKSGEPLAKIADKFGRKPESIHDIVYRMGVHRKVKPKYDVVKYARSKCWDCARAVLGGCEWADSGRPVPGWKANSNRYYDGQYQRDCYEVIECPKFAEDDIELEHEAIRRNQEEAPFYNLLAAVYKLMTEEYWSCCKTITTVNRPLNEKDDAASRLIYLREFFKNTKALPILEKHTARHDWVMQYLDTYQRRMERRRK